MQCDKCSGAIHPGAKFCPHCGDPVTEADAAVTGLAASKAANVDISFGRSTSATYEQALKIARNIPTYTEEGEGKLTRHAVTLPITEIELIINLWELTGSWKTSRLLINGQPASKKDLVYKCLGCFRERQKAYNREQYCYGESQYESNLWGCKQLRMPLGQWGGGWLQYGNMTKGGVWVVDKARIRHELELKIHENELCPILDPAHVLATLESFPDKINPKTDSDWEYETRYEEVNGKYQNVAVGVKPVVKRAVRYVLGDYKPAWDFDIQQMLTAEPSVPEREREVESPRSNLGAPGKAKKSGCFTLLVSASVLTLLLWAALLR